MLSVLPVPVVNCFAIIGLVLGIPVVYRFLSFVWIYFIRSSSVDKYLSGPSSYALVTGATDGIGKAVAKELYHRGFNLLLHGRNESKMKNVIQEIKASGGGKEIHYFLADATKPGHSFKKILEPYSDLNITLVFNNVGGTPVKSARLDEWSEDEILGTVRWNALFPLLLMNTLLPQLRRSLGPVLVMNIGSYSGDLPPPRLAIYAASKRFMEFLGRGLSMDERYYTPTNVKFMYLIVGQVATNAYKRPVTFVCPDADTFAKAVVDRIGCNRKRISPYVNHALAHWFAESLGVDIGEMMVALAMKQLFFKDGKKVE